MMGDLWKLHVRVLKHEVVEERYKVVLIGDDGVLGIALFKLEVI
jgi:hypothetical protein